MDPRAHVAGLVIINPRRISPSVNFFASFSTNIASNVRNAEQSDMLEITGGILLAVAALTFVVISLRYLVLALSAIVSLALFFGVWLLLTSAVGPWWGTAATILAVAGLFVRSSLEDWRTNQNLTDGVPDVVSTGEAKHFGRKMT